VTSVGHLPAQLGINCEKPLHLAQVCARNWSSNAPQHEKAEIVFDDAAHVRSDHRLTGQEKRNSRRRATGRRHNMRLFPAISAKTESICWKPEQQVAVIISSTQLDTLKPDSIGRMAVTNNAIFRINIRVPMQKAIDK
jgi:hypothetical protein